MTFSALRRKQHISSSKVTNESNEKTEAYFEVSESRCRELALTGEGQYSHGQLAILIIDGELGRGCSSILINGYRLMPRMILQGRINNCRTREVLLTFLLFLPPPCMANFPVPLPARVHNNMAVKQVRLTGEVDLLACTGVFVIIIRLSPFTEISKMRIFQTP